MLQRDVACRVNDHASTTTISHEYDRIVVGQERLTSISTVPLGLRGVVRSVLHGGVRDR